MSTNTFMKPGDKVLMSETAKQHNPQLRGFFGVLTIKQADQAPGAAFWHVENEAGSVISLAAAGLVRS